MNCKHTYTDIQDNHHACCADKHTEKKSTCHNNHDSEEKCCEIERISIDIEHRIYKPALDNNLSWLLIFQLGYSYLYPDQLAENIPEYSYYTDAIPILPRDYLSLIRVLII